MRRLYFASSYVMVADLTCKAVLRYARALANHGTADIVTIPVITEGGSQALAHLLLGPNSQLFSTPIEESQDEPVDTGVIAELERLTRELQPSRPAWPQEMTDIPNLSDYDLDYLDTL
ncbi:hypothetical protein [Subtercola sp. YIM 133946]|uniref:hypothetical protein n=1 Tax=Subtercola sp. YIM 133946 TaxID=3118909 RepID=UPI002F95E5DA